MPVPKSVKRSDMLEALSPLAALLDIDVRNTFNLEIAGSAITFAISPEDHKEIGNKEGRGMTDAIGVVAHVYSVEVD